MGSHSNFAMKAPYITNRRSCTFHPNGSNIYSFNDGVKLTKTTVAGHDWLDSSIFRIMYDLVNTDNVAGHKLRPIGSLWSFFSRMRDSGGIQILEDTDMYNMVHEMFSIFTAEDSRDNDYAEGFVHFWEHVVDPSHVTVDWLKGHLVSSTHTVLFKPLRGIINQRSISHQVYANHNRIVIDI